MAIKTCIFSLSFVLCIFLIIPACATSGPSIGLTTVPCAFNPSGGPLKISHTLNDIGPADVNISIIDNTGNTIQYLDQGVGQGLTNITTWDGLQDNGRPAPEGNYTVKAITNSGVVPVPQFFLRLEPSLLTNSSRLYYYPYIPAIDSKGNLYVTDGRLDCVLKFDLHGNFLFKWGFSGHGDGQFSNPTGIAIDHAGNVYVVDSKNNRVETCDENGRFLRKFGSYGTGDGQFNHPAGIATDSNGNVYVTDTGNDRVQYFNNNGTFLGKWGVEGNAGGSFASPYGIAIDDLDTVYVTDTYNHRVQKFNLAGMYLGELGNTGDHRLVAPTGIAVNGSGSLLVADGGNRRVTEYGPDGRYLRKEYAPTGSVNAASRPVGSFAKMISNGYIVRWDPVGNDPDGFAWLSGYGCMHVTKLNPLSIGETTSYSKATNLIVDRTAPSICIKTPSDGINYGRYQKIMADWSASDSISGLNHTTGSVPDGNYIDTNLPGQHVFTVQASDKAGNIGTLTYKYNVMDAPQAPQNGQGTTSVPVPIPFPGNGNGNSNPGPVTTPTPTPASTPVPPSTPTVVPGPIGAVVQFASTQIRAEIARTSEQINQGLMYRTSMAGDRGMLFIFSGDGMHSFHMQNTYIPLDMIFITSDLKIVNIDANAQPLSTNWRSSGSPCHYVLEVNGGVCAAHGIRVGDTVSIALV